MKTAIVLICSIVISAFATAQTTAARLDAAVKDLEKDSQMKSAVLGFYVLDKKGGEIVFSKNADMGLAAASSQKVITSTAFFDLLGAEYRYKTDLDYSGSVENGILKGNIYIVGNGDPTLGSWRYDSTKEQVILNKWIKALKQAGIRQIFGNIVCYNNFFESQTIPGGWIWDDIGNYYGAGVSSVNWRENQYDLILKSGSTGDKVTIVNIRPKLYDVTLANELTAGKPATGDNAYIYLAPYAKNGFIRGTIPPNESSFSVSGSFPNPGFEVSSILKEEMQRQNIDVNSTNVANNTDNKLPNVTSLATHYSPAYDSINYWFLKKSINLYGEALVKTLGYEKLHDGSTQSGLKIIKNFWKSRGLDTTSINIIDGSGLSPQNRITAEALSKVMEYARSRPWFSSFFNALPEINGIRMKSGTIGGVRSFTGYTGKYTFAIIINNYNGSSNEITGKIYRLLNMLK